MALEIRPRSLRPSMDRLRLLSGSEVLIGRYDPRDQHFACINVGKGDGGVVQSGTRHVRVDERGWLWLTHRGVVWYTTGRSGSPFSASLPDIDFSAYAPDATRIARAISGLGFGEAA